MNACLSTSIDIISLVNNYSFYPSCANKDLLEINPRNDLRIVCDAYLDTDEKVDIVLNDILSGKIKTNDDFGYKVLEIDCGFDVRAKEN